MAKIYKITDNLGQIYIGSTIHPLAKRFSKHKSSYKNDYYHCMSKLLMDNEPNIELIEECSIKDRLKREGYYIRNYPECVNKHKNIGLGLTRNELQKCYYKNNKEQIKKKDKDRYQKNNEQIKKQKKEYYQKNKEEIVIKKREYRKKNKDKINARRRELYKIKKINKM